MKGEERGERGCGFFLHRAPLVVPVEGTVLENGAVLTYAGKIEAVGFFSQLKQDGAKVIDHEDAVLVPGLINCHTHLELSFLSELGQDKTFFLPGDMTAWIDVLVNKRSELSGNIEENMSLACISADAMYHSGIVVAADIGNRAESKAISDNSLLKTIFFLEAFGLSGQEVPEVERRLAVCDDLAWTGHALYSTHSELIQRLKKRAHLRGDIFPIHTAESVDEVEFLQSGSGAFAGFLEKRLNETEPQKRTKIKDIFTPPGKGPIAHLADIGCLDQKTLCVHCVHVDEYEIKLLADSGASVCLCPGSNQYLGVGRAPVERFIREGIRLGLGTDSLASNPHMSLWREMKLLSEDNPAISAKALFQMATINGAKILGLEESYGSLIPGKEANMLAVHDLDANKNNVYERLVQAGLGIQLESV